MAKIAKACIKNTKRLLKKIKKSNLNGLDIPEVVKYEKIVKDFFGDDMDLETFILNFKTKELLIEKSEYLFDSPYLAVRALYRASKAALIATRNKIIYGR